MRLLLEIGVEELPQSEVYSLERQLRENTENLFGKYRLRYEHVKPVVAPRRLGVLVFGVAERQEDLEEKRRGPSKRAAFNQDGTPSRALLGFVNSIGASLEEVTVENTDKGEYVFVVRKIRGRETREVISELLMELVGSLSFARPMRWGDSRGPFVRPVHWVVALLDGELIPLEIFGVPSGKVSGSHRFLNKMIEVPSANEYPGVMTKGMVIPFIDERRERVKEELERIERMGNLKVLKDEELIDEVVALTEYPTAFLGEFNESFLKLPAEIVETALKHHQRVFAVERNGRLVNRFVAFIDGPSSLEDSVRNGYRRVIEARLEDATFYMEKDRQKRLEDFLVELDGIVFQRELGTMKDKVERIVELVAYISRELGITGEVLERALRAARLSKADIATMLVYEFPELQGTVARIYAGMDGEPPPVCEALEEQYMDLPESVEGALLCLADKLDTIVGNFLIGNVPSGSRDPYGLRRKAFSIMRTLIEFEWDLDLGRMAERCTQLIGIGTLDENFAEFMRARLQSILDEEGLDYDVVRAVLHLWRTPLRAFLSGRALQRVKNTEAYQKLAVGFERVHNISRKHRSTDFDTRLFKEGAEYELFKLYSEVKPRVEDHLKHLDYGSALEELIKMKDTIDRYFDNVFVMDGDLAIRMNRLGFLKSLSELFFKVADLRHLVVEKG